MREVSTPVSKHSKTRRSPLGSIIVISMLVAGLALDTGVAHAGSFVDVLPGDFFHDDVEILKDREITTGTSPTTYEPDRFVTRGETVTFLYRYSGEPAGYPAITVFGDVPSDRFYSVPVSWAYFRGITTGKSATVFDPDAPVTRAEMVTFLWRCAGTPDVPDAHGFNDVVAGSFYEAAVRWARKVEVTEGISPTIFGPNEPTTRGQMASFIARMGKHLGWVECLSNFSGDIPDQPEVITGDPGAPDPVAGMVVLRLVNGAPLDVEALLSSDGGTAVSETFDPCTGSCGPYPDDIPKQDPWCQSGGSRTVDSTVVVLIPGDYIAAISAPDQDVDPFSAEWVGLAAGVVYQFCVLERTAV
jgi:hypothetical protein